MPGTARTPGTEERDRDIDIDFTNIIVSPVVSPVNSEMDKKATPKPITIGSNHIKAGGVPGTGSGWRHTCASCGQYFDNPLVVHGHGGHICEACRRGDEQIAPQQADSQTKLAEVQAI
jgi:hypothetical protein